MTRWAYIAIILGACFYAVLAWGAYFIATY